MVSQETALIPNMPNLNIAQQLVRIQATLENIQNSLQNMWFFVYIIC
jgi:hypothetical protein